MIFSRASFVLALAGMAIASPLHEKQKPLDDYPEVQARKKLHLGTAIGGALDLPTTVTDAPTPTAAAVANVAAQAQRMTITVVNKHGDDISTIHVHGSGPTAVAGNVGPGRMHNGQSASFVVEAGWTGNIAINDALFSDTTGDESLIEASFVNQGAGYAQGDVNVSFVNGFSAAIVCWCNQNNLAVGCNKNLFNLNQCGNNNGQNSCKNPLRADNNARSPAPFFRPCFYKGGAYTFPNDSAANQLNAKCPNENYTCCIGHECRSAP